MFVNVPSCQRILKVMMTIFSTLAEIGTPSFEPYMSQNTIERVPVALVTGGREAYVNVC